METDKKKLIGLSVSFCVQDILSGKVKEEDVGSIIGGTMASSPDEWNGLIDMYRKSYWDTNPDEGEAICRRLIAAGKIDQPRLRGETPPGIASGIWQKSY